MLTLHVPPAQVYGLASFLRQHGADSIIVAEIEYVFAPDNPLYAKLAAGLVRSSSRPGLTRGSDPFARRSDRRV